MRTLRSVRTSTVRPRKVARSMSASVFFSGSVPVLIRVLAPIQVALSDHAGSNLRNVVVSASPSYTGIQPRTLHTRDARAPTVTV